MVGLTRWLKSEMAFGPFLLQSKPTRRIHMKKHKISAAHLGKSKKKKAKSRKRHSSKKTTVKA